MYLFDYDNLKGITQTEKGREYVEYLRNYYEENFADNPILALKYSYAKLFSINGNRTLFQAMYSDRRKRLMALQVLAIADDKYIEPLEDVLAAICDEFTWVLPAHAANHLIDLMAAETSMYLAETSYVMGERLSEEIRKRIYTSIENKIIKIYENNSFIWDTTRRNNWDAVCASGVGISYLYLFPERFPRVKDRLFKTFDLYLESLDKDGYCTEGYSYWVYGFSFFCLFYDVYEQLTGEHAAVLDSELVKNIALYGQYAKIDKDFCLPYADGGRNNTNDQSDILCTIERMFGVDLNLKEKGYLSQGSRPLGYRVLVTLDRSHSSKKESVGTVFYNVSQVFIRRNGNYAFTVKGGHNDECHNHNDVGTFAIFKNGKQYIADIGVGEYTAYYFKAQYRYGIFPCSSLSHSVPIVDGKAQEPGKEYCATVLSHDETSVTYDIAKAYKDGATKLIAAYRTEQDGVGVSYSCEGIKENIVFRFASFTQPQIKDGKVFIEDMEIETDINVSPEIKANEYSNYSGEKTIAYTIDYEVIKSGNVNAEFKFKFN